MNVDVHTLDLFDRALSYCCNSRLGVWSHSHARIENSGRCCYKEVGGRSTAIHDGELGRHDSRREALLGGIPPRRYVGDEQTIDLKQSTALDNTRDF